MNPRPSRLMPAGQVLVVGLVAFGLGLLLNADSLYGKAQGLPYGWRRRLAVDVMHPIHGFASTTRIDRPREWLEDAIGKDAGPEGAPPPVTTPPSSATTTPPSVTTTTLPPVTLRRPTAAHPLSLWVGGDSMTQVFGQSLQRMSVDRGDINATLDYRISTGLSRPDYFDWPAHLQNDVLPTNPEVIVIMFGANDSQSLNIDGTVRSPSTPEWQAEYRRRVAATMDLLKGNGRLTLWIGQPVMRDSGFSARMQTLDTIYQSEAATRPWIKYVDTRALFADSGGNYSAYLPGSDGKPALMRQQDGIHLSRPGGDRLSTYVLTVLNQDIDKLAGPAPTTTTVAPASGTPPAN